MIVLNTEEISALCSLTKKGNLLGLYLAPDNKPQLSRLVDVEKSLHEKEILHNRAFTDKGLITLRLIEDYQDSETHVLVNNISAAFNRGEENCIVFDVSSGELVISRFARTALWQLFVNQHDFLQEKPQDRWHPYFATPMCFTDFEKEMESQNTTPVFYVQCYQGDALYGEYTYYYEGDKIQRYDHLRDLKLQRDSAQTSLDFKEFLQLKEVRPHVG